MNPDAVIFDVYGTLLEVLPPPRDARARWKSLAGTLALAPVTGSKLPSLPALSRATSDIVRRHHEEARARGIPHPEVDWPAVLREALPPLASLPSAEAHAFALHHIGLLRQVRLAPGAPPVLRLLRRRRIPLGIASNAQAYTLTELEHALVDAGLPEGLRLFEEDLRFWSFEHGFSKPDPGVFRFLSRRLAARSLRPSATLMVGDRADNDIAPALVAGWRTWHLPNDPGSPSGWDFLLAALGPSTTAPGHAP